jgi:phosphoribosylanthranilate isomerase
LDWFGDINKIDSKRYGFKYLTKILREVYQEDEQATDGGTVYKQILIDAKLRTENRGQKNRFDWEKSFKETKVRIGL